MTKLAPSPLPISSRTMPRTIVGVRLVVDVEAAPRSAFATTSGMSLQRLGERDGLLLRHRHRDQRRAVVDAGEATFRDLPVGHERQHVVTGARLLPGPPGAGYRPRESRSGDLGRCSTSIIPGPVRSGRCSSAKAGGSGASTSSSGPRAMGVSFPAPVIPRLSPDRRRPGSGCRPPVRSGPRSPRRRRSAGPRTRGPSGGAPRRSRRRRRPPGRCWMSLVNASTAVISTPTCAYTPQTMSWSRPCCAHPLQQAGAEEGAVAPLGEDPVVPARGRVRRRPGGRPGRRASPDPRSP